MNFVAVYKIINSFLAEEKEKLRVVDKIIIRVRYYISANIIECRNRNTTKDCVNFLYNVKSSAFEVKYFSLFSKDLNLVNEMTIVIKTLNSLIKLLKGKLYVG